MAILLALAGAILGGVCITLSLTASSRLRSFLGNPLAAASINFAGGSLLLLILFGIGAIEFPELNQRSRDWQPKLAAIAAN